MDGSGWLCPSVPMGDSSLRDSSQTVVRIFPLTGQVLVEVLPADKRSAGGIDLPEHTMSPEENQYAARRPTMPPGLTGVVKAIGPWPKLANGMMAMPEFGVGARVVISLNAGLEMHRGIGERLKMVRNDQVLAVLTEGREELMDRFNIIRAPEITDTERCNWAWDSRNRRISDPESDFMNAQRPNLI